MLKTPTPFPQVGSYALYHHEGALRLARIVARNGDGSAVVSLPERPDAGGNLTVEVGQLIDGTPLELYEVQELRELERKLHPILQGKRRATTATQREGVARVVALGERNAHAKTLADRITRHEERQRAQRSVA